MQSELLLPVRGSYWCGNCMWQPYCHSPNTAVFHITLWQEWAKTPERAAVSQRDAFLCDRKASPSCENSCNSNDINANSSSRCSQLLVAPSSCSSTVDFFRAAWNCGSSSTVIISGWKNVPGSELSIPGKGTWLWIPAYGQIFLLWSRYCCDSFINGKHAREDCHLI